MGGFFWTNTIWYILLGFLTIFELIYIFSKVKTRKLAFAFYTTLCGIALSMESILFIVYGAYHYYPKIILTSYYDDELAGNLFSQFSMGATGLLYITLNLKRYWLFIFAAAYGAIEELFLATGIYSHNWYATWITVVGVVVLFSAEKKLYMKIRKGTETFLHYLCIFFGLFSLDVVTLLWGFLLSGYQNYTNQLGYKPVASRYLVAILYYFVISITLMIIYFKRLKLKWRSVVILMLYGANYVLEKLHIFWFKDGFWYFIFTTVTIFSVYFSIILLDYLYKSDLPQI